VDAEVHSLYVKRIGIEDIVGYVYIVRRVDNSDATVDAEVDSLYVKRIGIEDLVGYVYIVRLVDNSTRCCMISKYLFM
jgi:23S rRNA maturation mini-RNase III